jgi:hypothetical protein
MSEMNCVPCLLFLNAGEVADTARRKVENHRRMPSNSFFFLALIIAQWITSKRFKFTSNKGPYMNSCITVFLWTQAEIKNNTNPKKKFTSIRLELFPAVLRWKKHLSWLWKQPRSSETKIHELHIKTCNFYSKHFVIPNCKEYIWLRSAISFIFARDLYLQ